MSKKWPHFHPYKQVSFRNIWPFTKVTRMRKLECMVKLSIFVFTPAHAKYNTDFFFFLMESQAGNIV